ncbi:MAG: hypothetical protein E4H01_07270 [Lysobacterales bacterium]|nr:MAG: hypothetical protein E4H01_07270 [Xanthomonadales bacterium]
MAKSVRQAIEDHAPWKPPKFEDADAAAVKALAQGNASIHQQKRAFAWIVECAANTYDLSYRPGVDGDRETAFAEGRRFVGLQLVKMVNLKIGARPNNSEEG